MRRLELPARDSEVVLTNEAGNRVQGYVQFSQRDKRIVPRDTVSELALGKHQGTCAGLVERLPVSSDFRRAQAEGDFRVAFNLV